MGGPLQFLLPLLAPSRTRPTGQAPSPTRAQAVPETRSATVLAGRGVVYRLRRSRRRSIGFTIDASGLAVSAPTWVGTAEIDRALQHRAAWIVQKLDEWQARARERDARRATLRDAGTVPWLGEPLPVEVVPVAAGRRLPLPVLEDGRLRLPLHEGASDEAREARIEDWLRARARERFAQSLADFRERFGVAPRRWAISAARSRWGSCTADGTIRLNWRLVRLPPALLDYVVAHELAHLKELNHSPRFWAEVERLYPDWRVARQALREHPDAVTVD